jgi:hypothetical protein
MFIHCTFWSISLSRRSLIVHPAPRRRMAPTPNNASVSKSGRFPVGAASAMDLIQEHDYKFTRIILTLLHCESERCSSHPFTSFPYIYNNGCMDWSGILVCTVSTENIWSIYLHMFMSEIDAAIFDLSIRYQQQQHCCKWCSISQPSP